MPSTAGAGGSLLLPVISYSSFHRLFLLRSRSISHLNLSDIWQKLRFVVGGESKEESSFELNTPHQKKKLKTMCFCFVDSKIYVFVKKEFSLPSPVPQEGVPAQLLLIACKSALRTTLCCRQPAERCHSLKIPPTLSAQQTLPRWRDSLPTDGSAERGRWARLHERFDIVEKREEQVFVGVFLQI